MDMAQNMQDCMQTVIPGLRMVVSGVVVQSASTIHIAVIEGEVAGWFDDELFADGSDADWHEGTLSLVAGYGGRADPAQCNRRGTDDRLDRERPLPGSQSTDGSADRNQSRAFHFGKDVAGLSGYHAALAMSEPYPGSTFARFLLYRILLRAHLSLWRLEHADADRMSSPIG